MIRLKLNCISGRQISTLCLGITQKTRGLLLVGRRCFGVRSRNTLIATGKKKNLQQLVKLALWCYWHYRSKNGLVLLRSWIILPAGLTTKEADSGDRIVGLSGCLRFLNYFFVCLPVHSPVILCPWKCWLFLHMLGFHYIHQCQTAVSIKNVFHAWNVTGLQYFFQQSFVDKLLRIQTRMCDTWYCFSFLLWKTKDKWLNKTEHWQKINYGGINLRWTL